MQWRVKEVNVNVNSCTSFHVGGDFMDICFIYLFVCLFIGCAASGILVPQPGIEHGPSTVKARSSTHWNTREFPCCIILNERMNECLRALNEPMVRMCHEPRIIVNLIFCI